MTSQFWWYVARSSGIVAWALTAAAVIWGLLLSTRLLDRTPSPRWLLDLHRYLGGLSVVFVGMHLTGLVADNYVHFGWLEVLVPGTSSWQPLAVAWGVTALYAQVVVTFSFYVRDRIGQKAWRTLHAGAFGTFAAVTLHGIQAGTDAQHPAAVAMYATAATLVVGLTVIRGITYGAQRRRSKPARPAARAAAPAPAES